MEEINSKLDFLDRSIKTLSIKHEQVLTRIVGVTDDTLLSSLQEDCKLIENEMNIVVAKRKEQEEKWLVLFAREWFAEFKQFYENRHFECSLDEALLLQNFDIKKECIKLRMREISSLSQKRELCILMNALNKQIKIIDFECAIIDYIGKNSNSGVLIIKLGYFICEKDSLSDSEKNRIVSYIE